MSFIIDSITAQNFRNYQHSTIEFNNKVTVLFGHNASGKTNIIEGLQLLTAIRSFRYPKTSEITRWGQDRCILTLKATEGIRKREVELCIQDDKRTYSLNGKRNSQKNSLIGIIPTVLFTPQDLKFVQEASAHRRDTLDILGDQLSAHYCRLRNDYKKAVSGRNKLLKQCCSEGEVFDAWTDQMVLLGANLYLQRKKLLARLTPAVQKAYSEIDPCNTLGINYESTWVDDNNNDIDQLIITFNEALAAAKEEDIRLKNTTRGPHRDDINLTINNKEARRFGSQGQQRTIALAWKLAEVAVIEEITKNTPLLLLDDVMSELDENRRKALVTLISRGAQTVITTAHIKYFDPHLLEKATLVDITEKSALC